MKRLIPYLIFSLLLFITAELRAQEQRIGYVNTDQILAELPEYSSVEEQLEAIGAEWENQLTKMDREIEEFRKNFEAKEILYSDEQREQEQEKLEQLIRQRQDYFDEKFGKNGEYFDRQKELLEPIQRKVLQTIQEVADRRSIDFVFDRAQNTSLLLANEQWNLNKEVLEELGITLNDPSN